MIRKLLPAGLLAVGLVLLGLAALGASTANAQEVVTIHASTLTDHASSSTEWHFVITQVEGTTPASITVQWSNGTSSILPLAKLTGDTAHYSTTQHLGDGVTVVGATAVLPDGTTVGNFNLSHGPTGDNGGTTTTTAPEPTTTVPEPTTTVPEPTTTVPAPTTTVPEPTTTVPAPTKTEPPVSEPITTVPAPTKTEPPVSEPITTVPEPVVEGVIVTPEAGTSTSAAPVTALATTGSATVPLVIAGVAALIGGTVLLLGSRRRTAS